MNKEEAIIVRMLIKKNIPTPSVSANIFIFVIDNKNQAIPLAHKQLI
jgi:hypothetical protein